MGRCGIVWVACGVLGGAATAQSWTPMAPFGEGLSGICFDAARRRVVAVRPVDRFLRPLLAETWLHDGVRWRQAAPASMPFRAGSMAYDLARQRVVLFDGATWEFDGNGWQQAQPVNQPPGTGVLVYDVQRARVLQFGGWGFTPFLDTWEYDGVTWTQAFLNPNPPPRQFTTAAYHVARGVAVVVGGQSGGSQLSDTWEYDGQHWVQTVATGSPLDPLAYQFARGRLLAIGSPMREYTGTQWVATTLPPSPLRPFTSGFATNELDDTIDLAAGDGSGDLWHFDGAQWQARSVSPAPRAGVGMAFDAVRGRTVLFGGVPGNPPTAEAATTWEHDGVHWIAAATNGPGPRLGPALAFAVDRARTVLFGGNSAAGLLADTWTWDGSAWLQVAVASSPPAREGAVLAYDSRRRRCVLFGGVGLFQQLLGDTWTFDGAQWSAHPGAVAPPPRWRHAAAFDPTRGDVVLFGGADYSLTPLADTWLFDTAWRQLITVTAPRGRAGHVLVHDPLRGGELMLGGFPFGGPVPALAEAWLFTDGDWQLANVGTEAAGFVSSAAVDSARGIVRAFGSTSYALAPPLAASWVRFGSGCAGSAGVPSLDASNGGVPSLGAAFALRVTNLPATAGAVLCTFGFGIDRWLGAPLPLDLATVGLPGCSLWLAPSASLLLAHNGGSASVPLAIPAQPALAGTMLAAQALALDASAANGIGGVSNAGLGLLR